MKKNSLRFSEAAAEFLTVKKPHYARQTMRNYTSLLTGTAPRAWGDILLRNIQMGHVEKLMGTWANPATANVRHGQLRVFFEWCELRGYINRNPVNGVRTRRNGRQSAMVRTRIPAVDWPKVLDAAEAHGPVVRALVATGLYSGLRSSEMTALRISDIEFGEDGVIEGLYVGRSMERGYTKTGQSFLMPVNAELDEELSRWLRWYAARNGRADGTLPPNAYLLPARRVGQWVHLRDDNGRLRPHPDAEVNPFARCSTPHLIVANLLKELGLYKRGEGMHTLRRSFATALFNEDLDRGYSAALETTQNALRHQSIQTTQLYIGVDQGQQRFNDRMKRRAMFARNEAAGENVVPFRRDDDDGSAGVPARVG